jgi:hypothetical protein
MSSMMLENNWGLLARAIWTDLNELPMTILPNRKDDLELIKAGIEEYRDYYFDIFAIDPEDPRRWRPTKKAIEAQEGLLKKDYEIRRKQERRGASALQNEN